MLFGYAQKQANIWYFGTRVGLDFNYTPPLPLNNGAANSEEGSAAISNHNGRLLFYTNGVIVANRKHSLMKNGAGLLGDLSSTDNTIIIPSPGNDSIYYLFTIGSVYQVNKGLRYNIINMRGDAGFGEVVSKNISLEPSSFEKLAAVKHCNNRDVWVVIHKWNSDEYHAFLVTASGVSSTPVVSHTGLFINNVEDNAIGKLKFSIEGDQLAAAHSYENNVVELMEFDNTTGLISNPVVFRPGAQGLPPQYLTGTYAVEFSPNGNLLYVSDNSLFDGPSALYQFDISSKNAATILASRQTIANPDPWFSGALQLGPDNKIYMAMPSASYLSVIENPDVYGPGCNFRFNQIFLGQTETSPVQFGLPNFIQSYFNPLSNPYDFSRLGSCLNRTITFTINRLNGIDSVKWDFGDAQQSQALQPTHTYAASGFYDVNLIVYKIDCSGLNDTITRKIWIAGSNEFLGADTSSCNALTLEIGVEEIFGVNYLWNTGNTGNKITATGFGDYWLQIEQNGCTIADTIKISPKPQPVVSLGVDTTICKYKPVVLKTGNIYDSYTWSTGATTPTILVNQTGTYYVTVTQSACEASDTIQVLQGDCDVYIPSAFTPNNDNLNETFGVVENSNVLYFSFQIYSKWGELIFYSKDITQKWDGTFKGKKMPNGAYFWMLNYTNSRGRKMYEQGMVMLIR